jgi:lysozyme
MAHVKHHRARTLTLSHHGASFIAREEGVRTRPYTDSLGWSTTGVGHLIQPAHHGVTDWDVHHWSFPSAASAINYFRTHDVLVYVKAVRDALGDAWVTQAQFDMCVSLCFNIGTAGFRKSRVCRLIRAGKRRAAAFAFLGWARPAVLLGRRRREMAVFLRARY